MACFRSGDEGRSECFLLSVVLYFLSSSRFKSLLPLMFCFDDAEYAFDDRFPSFLLLLCLFSSDVLTLPLFLVDVPGDL